MEINSKIDQTHDLILQVLAQSQLPLGVIFYILKDILNSVEKHYYGFLNSQALKEDNEQLEEKSSQVSQGQAN